MSKKIGRNEPCPCGSGKKYKRCHGGFNTVTFTPVPKALMEPLAITPGETPEWLKELVEATVKYIFDGESGFQFVHSQLGRSARGELCASVALLTLELLAQYGVKSRIVFGSAKWDFYPVAFIWKGEAEYHAWIQTQYGEVIDLACDALNQRSGISLATRSIRSPRNCWDKLDKLKDRLYTEVPFGGQEIDIDLPDSPQSMKIAEVALAYARAREQDFRNRFGGP